MISNMEKELPNNIEVGETTTDYILFGNKTEDNKTIKKINSILNKSSDKFITYTYKILNTTNSYMKSSDKNKI